METRRCSYGDHNQDSAAATGRGKIQKLGTRDVASILSTDAASPREGLSKHNRNRNRKWSELGRPSLLAPAAAADTGQGEGLSLDRRRNADAQRMSGVVHFVYSEAVEKAIRRGGYKTSALPPLTGANFRKENTFMVPSIPTIFSDLVATRRARRRNLEWDREYRKSLPDMREAVRRQQQQGELGNGGNSGAIGGAFSRLKVKLTAAGVVERFRGGKLAATGSSGRGAGCRLSTLLLSRGRQLQGTHGASPSKDSAPMS